MTGQQLISLGFSCYYPSPPSQAWITEVGTSVMIYVKILYHQNSQNVDYFVFSLICVFDNSLLYTHIYTIILIYTIIQLYIIYYTLIFTLIRSCTYTHNINLHIHNYTHAYAQLYSHTYATISTRISAYTIIFVHIHNICTYSQLYLQTNIDTHR